MHNNVNKDGRNFWTLKSIDKNGHSNKLNKYSIYIFNMAIDGNKLRINSKQGNNVFDSIELIMMLRINFIVQ